MAGRLWSLLRWAVITSWPGNDQRPRLKPSVLMDLMARLKACPDTRLFGSGVESSWRRFPRGLTGRLLRVISLRREKDLWPVAKKFYGRWRCIVPGVLDWVRLTPHSAQDDNRLEWAVPLGPRKLCTRIGFVHIFFKRNWYAFAYVCIVRSSPHSLGVEVSPHETQQG